MSSPLRCRECDTREIVVRSLSWRQVEWLHSFELLGEPALAIKVYQHPTHQLFFQEERVPAVSGRQIVGIAQLPPAVGAARVAGMSCCLQPAKHEAVVVVQIHLLKRFALIAGACRGWSRIVVVVTGTKRHHWRAL